MSLSAIPSALRRVVFDRNAGTCAYCHLKQFGQCSIFHINHVIPKSRGGPTTADNLVLQCPHCSLQKSNKTEAINEVTGQIALLFDPLQQVWLEHFIKSLDGTIVGKTPIGRATINALQMNESLPKTARAVQSLLENL